VLVEKRLIHVGVVATDRGWPRFVPRQPLPFVATHIGFIMRINTKRDLCALAVFTVAKSCAPIQARVWMSVRIVGDELAWATARQMDVPYRSEV
jgi:hypothetical protein